MADIEPLYRYRKRPVTVAAFRLGHPLAKHAWFVEKGFGKWVKDGNTTVGINIETLAGTMRANFGDWIIRGIKGEWYPCKPDIFYATYEKASSDD